MSGNDEDKKTDDVDPELAKTAEPEDDQDTETEEDTEPQEAQAEAEAEGIVSRKGIYRVELTIHYEDGWEQTMKTPGLFVIKQVGDMGGVQLPAGVQATAKFYSASEINKTVQLLEGLIDDLRNTIPSPEEIEAAKKKALQDSVDAGKRAELMGGPRPGQIPINPVTGQPLQFPPGRRPGG